MLFIIMAAYLIFLSLIIISLFSMAIQANSFVQGISKSPIYLSPSLISLTIGLAVVIVGGWLLTWWIYSKFLGKQIGY